MTGISLGFDDRTIPDDTKLYYGSDRDYSIRYDSSSDEMIVYDEVNNVEITRYQRDGQQSFQSISTERASINSKNVYVYNANGNLVENIDPSTTTTPIADASAAIGGPSVGGGIVVPPTTITEGAELPADTLRFTELIGYGRNVSKIEFTDTAADGITVSPSGGSSFTYIDGVTLDGSDGAVRAGNGTAAIHFESNAWQFNMGRMGFSQWGDRCIYQNTGHPFQCTWENIHGFQNQNLNGPVLDAQTLGNGHVIGNITCHSNSAAPGVNVNGTSGELVIGTLAVGTSQNNRALVAKLNEGTIQIGSIHYEPASTANPIEAVFSQGAGTVQVGHITTSIDAERVYSLRFNNGNDRIGHIRATGTINTNLIEVIKAVKSTSYPSYYFGPSGDVTNSTATAGAVQCLSSAGSSV